MIHSRLHPAVQLQCGSLSRQTLIVMIESAAV